MKISREYPVTVHIDPGELESFIAILTIAGHVLDAGVQEERTPGQLYRFKLGSAGPHSLRETALAADLAKRMLAAI